MYQRSSAAQSFLVLASLGMVLLLLFPSPAQADSYLMGESIAEEVNDPNYGTWKYTITLQWDTGTNYCLSHLDVILDFDCCPCCCTDFPFAAPDTAGYCTGTIDADDWIAYFYAMFNCEGDPSIPGDEGPLVKFEPHEDECQPAPSGEGTFWFFTDWAPIPIEEPNLLLAIKFDQAELFGNLSGMLPGCECDPTASVASTWGRVKQLYH